MILIYHYIFLTLLLPDVYKRQKYDKAESVIYSKYKNEHPHITNDEWKDYIRHYDVYENIGNIKKK